MEISIYEPVDLIITLMKTTINGMTDRIRRLRQESFDTQPSVHRTCSDRNRILQRKRRKVSNSYSKSTELP